MLSILVCAAFAMTISGLPFVAAALAAAAVALYVRWARADEGFTLARLFDYRRRLEARARADEMLDNSVAKLV